MPRRKPRVEEPFIEGPILALPPPTPTKHRHEHIDAYASPPGAVPTQVTTEPIKRKMTSADLANREEHRREQRMLGARYDRYLDELADQGGDRAQALAIIFGVNVEEAKIRQAELHQEVLRGLTASSSSAAEILERNDLGDVARVRLLRKHAYSQNPVASLKAIDMTVEMAGERNEQGSFENFLRLAKGSK